MILQELKQRTRTHHEEVESAVDVMNRVFTLEDYKLLIGNFRCFYAAYEPTLPIGGLAAAGFDYEPRRKLPALERDAAALGVNDSNASAVANTARLDTIARAFGSLYVIEGSTLGGQVISRHLKQHLGLTPENGAAFFNSYGSEVGPMWKRFGAAISAFGDGGYHDDEIVGAAIETFESIKACVGRR